MSEKTKQRAHDKLAKVTPKVVLVPGVKDEDMDDAVVYGYAAASTIGHEMTHGFDDQGRQFDAKGNLKEWWLPRVLLSFPNAPRC